MRKSMLLAAALAVSTFAAAPAHAAVNLIVDGNFDNPLSPGTFTTIGGGSSFGAGNVWNVTGNSIDEIGNYWQAPPTGGGSVDLDGNAPGGINQGFNAAAGAYNLSFYLSGNPDGAPATKEVTVDVGGVSQNFFYTVTGDKSSMNFVLEHLVFTSAGGANTLSFTSQDINTPFGAVIGGVSISAVPEPRTWIMMILGFGLMGMTLRAARDRRTVRAA